MDRIPCGRNSRHRRAGFTLLEVLLAAAIGVLVMSALYVALEIQLRQTQIGREVVEESVLVRSLLNRMARDIGSSLQAIPKAKTSASSSSNPLSALTTLLTAGSATGESPAVPFNLGVQGSYDRLELAVSRVPRLPMQAKGSEVAAPPEGDVRRITYWMTLNGLAREEVKLTTSTDLADPVDETLLVIAPEVRGIAFRYFDGTTWQESWDGQTLDSAGAAKGPPLALEIILEIGPPSEDALFNPDAAAKTWKRFRHVVALPTASLPIGQAADPMTTPTP